MIIMICELNITANLNFKDMTRDTQGKPSWLRIIKFADYHKS